MYFAYVAGFAASLLTSNNCAGSAASLLTTFLSVSSEAILDKAVHHTQYTIGAASAIVIVASHTRGAAENQATGVATHAATIGAVLPNAYAPLVLSCHISVTP